MSDSSPTTTISTMGSSSSSMSATDSSAGSSPESPSSVLQLTAMRRTTTLKPAPAPITASARSSDDFSALTPPMTPFDCTTDGSVSPGRRPRNTKNLSLKVATASMRARPAPCLRIKTASAAPPLPFQSAPPSPVTLLPPRPPTKRRSKLSLTIQTPAFHPAAAAAAAPFHDRARAVPPTPSAFAPRPPSLRHHQSSPSLSLFSPTAGVPGGMTLPFGPAPARAAGHRPFHAPRPSFEAAGISEEMSPVRSPTAPESDDEDHGVPRSQEQKSPAYPAGPVCVYEPHVYLYLEPSAAEAAQFDVVLNVAREVRNPFARPDDGRLPGTDRPGPDPMPIDRTPWTDAPATAPGVEACRAPADPITAPPTTATRRATPQPEYLHVPWDHHSNIVDDLMHLVEVMDERVRQGKRVLVHCQCGVSRSASLIVAYGVYRDPSKTVQEVYAVVKERSRWIGPNMSLIYQLTEFRTRLLARRGRGRRHPAGAAGLHAVGRPTSLVSDRTSPPGHFPSVQPENRHSVPAPQTAPLPHEPDRDARPDPDGCVTPAADAVTPGPSSAPSAVTWHALAHATAAAAPAPPP
ncbi:MAG: hypothetical protein M1826_001253, partial [Phylliscum demangeonii]